MGFFHLNLKFYFKKQKSENSQEIRIYISTSFLEIKDEI